MPPAPPAPSVTATAHTLATAAWAVVVEELLESNAAPKPAANTSGSHNHPFARARIVVVPFRLELEVAVVAMEAVRAEVADADRRLHHGPGAVAGHLEGHRVAAVGGIAIGARVG